MTIALMSFVLVKAQPGSDGGDKKEKIEAIKIGYITKQLNLTADEAKVFWPVYNQYDAEMEVIRKGRLTELMNAKNNFESMSDADVSKTIDNEFNSQQQELNIKKKYNEEFKKVLPVKKVAKFWVAEQKFKLYLLEQLKQQKENGMPPPKGPGPGGPH
ncbi:hypothetical protein LBMAG27_16830 [Bacteroidota bacterium]|nr:hypothetical protein LBMAG27_16830 [Bacteroidota bacterium]